MSTPVKKPNHEHIFKLIDMANHRHLSVQKQMSRPKYGWVGVGGLVFLLLLYGMYGHEEHTGLFGELRLLGVISLLIGGLGWISNSLEIRSLTRSRKEDDAFLRSIGLGMNDSGKAWFLSDPKIEFDPTDSNAYGDE